MLLLLSSFLRFRVFLPALALASGGFHVLHAQSIPTYMEKDGVVSIEAEHPTDNVGPWEVVEGRNALGRTEGESAEHRLLVLTPENLLAAGLSGELALPPGALIPWGIPGPQALVAVRAGHDARKAVSYAYEAGAVLPQGETAAGRRVMVPAPSAQVTLFSRLFDGGLEWAMARPPTEPFKPRTALLLTATEPGAAEELLVERMRAFGVEVERVQAKAFEAAMSADKTLVVVSPLVRIEHLKGKLASLPLPVLVAGKADLAGDLGLVPPAKAYAPGENALLISEGAWTDHARYGIYFAQPGKFRLHLLGQSGGSEAADEPVLFFNQPPKEGSDAGISFTLKPELGWSSATGTPIEVVQPGWHTLALAKGAEPRGSGATRPKELRYPSWRVDKIVLLREAEGRPAAAPTGDGPAETVAQNVPPAPAEVMLQSEGKPSQIWALRDGFCVVEAERIDRHPNWALKTDVPGYTGSGYLVWVGPNRTRSIEEQGGNLDHLHVRQGPQEQALIVRVWVEQPGTYRLDLRNHHMKKDGDNDVWVSLLGQRGTPQTPIQRSGDFFSDGDGTVHTWLDWGVQRLQLAAGLNEIVLGGRSVGFGIDRIIVYADNNDTAKARAMDLKTLPTEPGRELVAVRDFASAPTAGQAPYYVDARSANPARHALAIDAKAHKDIFARAQAAFPGPAGRYDLHLVALGEGDGESTYRLTVAGDSLGERRNAPSPDGTVQLHAWPGVSLPAGAALAVESNTASNGKVPEGTAFGWARGRWTRLVLLPAAGPVEARP